MYTREIGQNGIVKKVKVSLAIHFLYSIGK